MSKTYYVAGFVPEEEGGYSVYFPDFPEIATSGGNLPEATENAADALRLLLESMTRNNDAARDPSPLDEIRARVHAIRMADDLPYPVDTLYQLVLAPALDTTPVRVNVSIPKGALDEIDEKARTYGYTRSGYLTHAALNYHP